jgi:hypothetical protein
MFRMRHTRHMGHERSCISRLPPTPAAVAPAVPRRDRVTSRWVVEFLDTVRGQFCDYAAVSSGIVTSLVSAVSRAMECSLK